MKSLNKNFNEKSGAGFTLIELLIVVAIITILAAGVVIGINPARQFRNTRNATRLSQMNTIMSSIYSYAVERGGIFPTDCPPDSGTTSASSTACSSVLVPDYIPVLPSPPLVKDGEEYVIEKTATGGIKITSTAEEATGTMIVQ